MKVRIGNDIRLNLTLRGPKSYDQANIKQLRAYFVNTSMKKFTEPWIDPCAGCCGPNAYSLHSCGPDHYHHLPYDCFRAGFCGYRHDHHHPHCCPFGCKDPMHCWHSHYCSFDNIHPSMRPNYGHPFHCDDHACYAHCSHYGHDMCDFGWAPVPPHVNEDFKFLAPSRVMEGYNRAQVYFPAADQFACGEYKLVIVLVLYETGWGRCDLHTYTIDYGKVLTLVDDESGVDGDVTIDVDTDSLEDGGIASLDLARLDIHMRQDSYLGLGAEDIRGQKYNINVTLKNGSVVPFDPNNWEFVNLKFQSTDEDVVEINPNGTLHSKPVVKDTQVKIIVKTADNHVEREFYVTVETNKMCYIGFSPVRPKYTINRIDQSFEDLYPSGILNPDMIKQEADGSLIGAENLNLSDLKKVSDIEGTHRVVNNTDGYYLWIVSNRPVTAVMSGLGDLPMSSPEIDANGVYYYACINPLQANTAENPESYIKVKC